MELLRWSTLKKFSRWQIQNAFFKKRVSKNVFSPNRCNIRVYRSFSRLKFSSEAPPFLGLRDSGRLENGGGFPCPWNFPLGFSADSVLVFDIQARFSPWILGESDPDFCSARGCNFVQFVAILVDNVQKVAIYDDCMQFLQQPCSLLQNIFVLAEIIRKYAGNDAFFFG